METFRTIMQIILLAFIIFTIVQCLLNRRKYPSRFDFVSNLMATIGLLVWLLIAGAFDKFIF